MERDGSMSAQPSRMEILGNAAARVWSTAVVFGGIFALFMAIKIVEAFLSGRAVEILGAITKAGL